MFRYRRYVIEIFSMCVVCIHVVGNEMKCPLFYAPPCITIVKLSDNARISIHGSGIVNMINERLPMYTVSQKTGPFFI